jgi:hypothetical protein
MFCDACGNAVQPGQAFCSKCGKQIVGGASFAQPRPGRVQGHVRLLALFWLAFSAFNTVGAIVLYVIANVAGARWRFWQSGGAEFLLASAAERSGDSPAREGCVGFYRGVGTAPARSLGSDIGSRSWIYFPVHQHSVRNGAGHLHGVGAAVV